MELFDKGYDEVVKSIFCSGKTTYNYAFSYFLPQVDKYYAQRKKVDEKFYQKLERDIALGCVMPPITIAIVLPSIREYLDKPKEEIIKLVEDQKTNIYVLDGIQRLNTLKKAYKHEISHYTIYFNLLISDSDDRLLYRMITLNNGQKPMSARHQIEVLAHNIFDFDNLPITIQTEKARSKKQIKGSFNKDDIIKGYISYLSESVNIDNQKIIESKMDELVADKIIESNVTQTESQFSKVIEKIEDFIEEETLKKWFKQPNNLIGFCAGIGKSWVTVKVESKEDFKVMIEKFEESFQSFDISKIKLGHLRRLTVQHFISKYDLMRGKSQAEVADNISQASMLFM